MDKTESVIGYLKTFPNSYAELLRFLSEQFKVQVTEEHLLKTKISVLLFQIIPFVESKGADMLDVMFFANYQRPDYTYLQLQSYSILLIFNKLEKKQPLTFLVF
jgi:hypothetical protein